MRVFLDDCRTPSMIYGESEGCWLVVRTVEHVIELLKTGTVTHLSLDNDLGEGALEGYHVVRWFIENDTWPTEHVWVHSSNVYRAKEMREDIRRYFYDAKGE